MLVVAGCFACREFSSSSLLPNTNMPGIIRLNVNGFFELLGCSVIIDRVRGYSTVQRLVVWLRTEVDCRPRRNCNKNCKSHFRNMQIPSQQMI